MKKNPINIDSLDHVVLRVHDVERMVEFYCQVLGCRIDRQQTDLGLTQLRAGSILIDLVSVDGEIGRKEGKALVIMDKTWIISVFVLRPLMLNGYKSGLQKTPVNLNRLHPDMVLPVSVIQSTCEIRRVI